MKALEGRLRQAVVVIVVAAAGIRLAAWLLAPLWPALLVLAAVAVLSIAIPRR